MKWLCLSMKCEKLSLSTAKTLENFSKFLDELIWKFFGIQITEEVNSISIIYFERISELGLSKKPEKCWKSENFIIYSIQPFNSTNIFIFIQVGKRRYRWSVFFSSHVDLSCPVFVSKPTFTWLIKMGDIYNKL